MNDTPDLTGTDRTVATVSFLPQLADAKDFAEARILAVPVQRRIIATPDIPWTYFDSERMLYNRARSALYHLAQVIDDGKVWLPAYHCPALVEPFLAAPRP